MVKKLVFAVLLLGLIAAAALGWRRTHPPMDGRQLTLYGNVDIRQVSLAFEGADCVAEMRVEEGERVAAGQVLAVLDTRTARLRLAQAEAQVAVLEQALLALRRGSRPEELAQAGAQDLDNARAQWRVAQSRLEAARQAEQLAPQAAVVRARLLEPGDMAAPQRPAYTLALSDPKWVRAYVSEPQLGRIRPGMAAGVSYRCRAE